MRTSRGLTQHPRTGRVRAATVNFDRRITHVLEPEVESDYERLQTVERGEVQIVSMSNDDRRWIVGYMRDDAPYRFYTYDRETKRAEALFTTRPALEEYITY
ncbi:MAG: hypothetical protein R3E12_02140 [Candidatus Eisenbacteria bacterium]